MAPTSETTRRRYSKDVKEIILYQAQILQRPTSQISYDLNIPRRVVQRVLQVYKEIGQAARDPKTYKTPGRPHIITNKVADVSSLYLYSVTRIENPVPSSC
jgi:hypothetical protein